MGLSLDLYLVPNPPAETWARVWDETRDVLRRFPLSLCRYRVWDSDFGKRGVLSSNLVEKGGQGRESWILSGDFDSRMWTGSVTLHKDIEAYRTTTEWNAADPLSPSCTRQEFRSFGGIDVFGARTMGYPFHHALTAVGMLLESRFPDNCFLQGEVSIESCMLIRDWLNSFVENKVALPACLDPGRLWNRLEGLCNSDTVLVERFCTAFAGDCNQEARWLFNHSQDAARMYYANSLLAYPIPTQWGAVDIVRSVLEASQDINVLLDVIELRNHLAMEATSRGEEPHKAYDWIDLLAMLCNHFVTVDRWDGQSVRELTQEMKAEGTILEQVGKMFLRRMGAPTCFQFHIRAEELINAFARRQPEALVIFRKTVEDAEDKCRQALQEMNRSDDEALESLEQEPDDDDVSTETAGSGNDKSSFEAFVRQEAAHLRWQASDVEKGVAQMGTALQGTMLKDEHLGSLDCGQLVAFLTRCTWERDIILTEKAWHDIDNIRNPKLLKLLIILARSTDKSVTKRSWCRLVFESPPLWPVFLNDI